MSLTLHPSDSSDAVDVQPFAPGGITGRAHSSKFVGVGWNKRVGKWHAQIIVNGECRYLGTFAEEADAARAYDHAAREAYGDLATLNFPTQFDRERSAAWIGRREACCRFGVTIKTWWRWEREGRIQCGVRIGGRSQMYRIADIERLLDENGRLQPPYPDPERPGCCRLPLSGQDMRRREAIIDVDSLPLVEGEQWCWSGTADGRRGTIILARQGETTALRRIIMGVADVPTDEVQVTHFNGDPLDCRRANLVLRDVRQRVTSSSKRRSHHGKPCSSQFKGVGWNAKNGKWKSTIHAKGKAHHLGFFSDETDAAKAYDDAAREHFGEHAWLNFPGEGERGRRADAAPPIRIEVEDNDHLLKQAA